MKIAALNCMQWIAVSHTMHVMADVCICCRVFVRD